MKIVSSVFLRGDIVNILQGLAIANKDFNEALTAVAISLGIDPKEIEMIMDENEIAEIRKWNKAKEV